MLNFAGLLAVQSTVPNTPTWSPKVALIMITCNLFAIAIGFYAIPKANRGRGPAIPGPLPGLFEGFGLPELLATTSLGHLLGAGMILGLGNVGLL
ncbi:MAG: photosystem I reaction center subunit PsaK [Oscillatoriales cyanobacterium RM2_1_1]|nr:photosystem I reaction center subunit PsaK [Oscillatoriales cyanobacterium SM2_3_0]NJO46513.1 photosystem I reaction center subunit PsaK [Oscillatoriales cyanobacterium RM2_1_1]